MMNNNDNGFTLVELVVVILVLSVLAVSVVPRLTTPKAGISAVTDRDQLISLLRTVQTRAMQNTEDADCHGVNFTTSNIGMAAQANDDSCNLGSFLTTPDEFDGFLNLAPDNSYTAVNILGNSVTFVGFDDYGRPVDTANNNLGRIIITFDNLESVCIESEGYIHVCT
jgi:MSHA pilin protein MshC